MKKLLSVVLLAIALFSFTFGRPALAADTANGAKIFTARCVLCHRRGGNLILPDKALNKEALEKYGMDSLEAIINQVTNGKNAMPAFKGRLSTKEIEDVASYVLEQAQKGWTRLGEQFGYISSVKLKQLSHFPGSHQAATAADKSGIA